MAKDEIQNKEKTDIEKKPEQLPILSQDSGDFACYLDTAKFNQLYRVANMFSTSQLVPEHYRDKPSDCFIALQMAMRLQCEPMAFMQGTYVIYGKPGMEAKLAIALINSRGPFEGPVQWKLKGAGDERQATAYAKHKITGQVCEAVVSIDMAKKEGWYQKKGSKWQTMPDQMLQYRSATFLGRLHCPEVLYGLQTTEEIKDVGTTFVESQVQAEETINNQAGSQPIGTKFEDDNKQPATATDDSSLADFVCPSCRTIFKYNKDMGAGIQCPECDKDVLVSMEVYQRLLAEEKAQEEKHPPSESELPKWTCEGGHEFNEPHIGANGIQLCPECLSKQIKLKA